MQFKGKNWHFASLKQTIPWINMLTTHKSIKPSGVKIYRNVRNQCLVLNDKSVFLQSDVKVLTNVEFYTPD